MSITSVRSCGELWRRDEAFFFGAGLSATVGNWEGIDDMAGSRNRCDQGKNAVERYDVGGEEMKATMCRDVGPAHDVEQAKRKRARRRGAANNNTEDHLHLLSGECIPPAGGQARPWLPSSAWSSCFASLRSSSRWDEVRWGRALMGRGAGAAAAALGREALKGRGVWAGGGGLASLK